MKKSNDISHKKPSLAYKVWFSKILDSQPIPRLLAVILLIISSFQIIFLQIKGTYFVFSIRSSTLDLFLTTLANFMLGFDLIGTKSLSIYESLICAGTGFYLIIISSILVVSLYKIQKSRPLPAFILKFWGPIIYTHILILFLPIHNVLLGMSIEITQDEILRKDWGHILIVVFSLIGIVINCIWVFILHFATIVLKTKDPFARVSNTYVFFTAFQKFFISIIYRIVQSNISKNTGIWAAFVISAFFLSIQIYFFVRIPTFYRKSLRNLAHSSIIASWIVAIWNLIIIITQGFNAELPTGNFITILFAIIPLVIKGFQEFYEKYTFVDIFSTNLSSSYLKSHNALSIRKVIKILKNPIMNPEERIIKAKNIFDLGYKKLNSKDLAMENKIDVANFLASLTNNQKLPTLITLKIADVLLNECSFISHAYVICHKLLGDPNLSFREKLSALYINGQIQKLLLNYQSDNLDLISFMHSMQSHDLLSQLIENQVIARENFYLLIENDSPDLLTISKSSRSIQELQERINKIWSSLSRENIEEYPPLLKMFGFFKIFVELQSETGKELIKKYNQIILRKGLLENSKIKNIYSENAVFLIVGVDHLNFGKVIKCSNNIRNVFGYENKDLFNKNVALLMPETVSILHDNFIKSKLEDSDQLVQVASKTTYGKHRDGHIIPITYKSTLYPLIEEGLSFWGMIKSVQHSIEFMIVNENMIIEGMSKNLKALISAKNNEKIFLPTVCRIRSANSRRSSVNSSPLKLDSRNTSLSMMIYSSGLREKTNVGSAAKREIEKQLSEFSAQKTEFHAVINSLIPTEEKFFKFRCEVEIKSLLGRKLYIFSMKKRGAKLEKEISFRTENAPSEVPSDLYHCDEFDDGDIRYEKTERDADSLSPNNLTVSYNTNTITRKRKRTITLIRKVSSFVLQENEFDISYNSGKSNEGFENQQDEEDEIDGKISQRTERKDEGGASIASVSSSKAEKELELTLESVVHSLPYYKFRIAHIPFFFLVLFFISFSVMILMTYINASASTDEVKNRINVLDIMSQRGIDLAVLLSDLFPVYLFDKIFQRPFDNASLFYVSEGAHYSKEMIAKNNQLKLLVPNLSENEKNFFMAKDLRMYTANFQAIPNTTNYELVDSFTMYNSLYSNMMFYYNNYRDTKGQARNYALEFLFGNTMNDLWERHLAAPDILTRAMRVKIDSIYQTTNLLYGIVIALICLLAISLTFVLLKSYEETKSFLRIIINTGPSDEITHCLFNLRTFKKFMDKKIHGEHASQNDLMKGKKAKVEKSYFKSGRKGKLFSQMISRLLFCLILLVVPFVLTWKANTTYIKAADEIMPIIYDINNLNKILSIGMPPNSILGLMYTRPTTKIFNRNIFTIIDEEIEKAKSTVSLENNFLPETQKFLRKDLCPYYVVNARYPNCTGMFRQLGKDGIISVVLAAADYRKQYKTMITTLPITAQNIVYFVYQSDYIEIAFLYVFGIAPAISTYQTTMVNNLISNLEKASADTIVLFAPGISFGIVISLIIGIIIYKVIWKERRSDSKTLNILPLDLVMNNRNLKGFLLKRSYLFYKMVKKYEITKKKDRKFAQRQDSK